jgi:hypothetical protein
VVSTGLLSFFHERNASRVVEKLLCMISLKSTILRDGKAQEFVNKNVVVGEAFLCNHISENYSHFDTNTQKMIKNTTISPKIRRNPETFACEND